MSPAAARVSNVIPLEAPTNAKPGSRAAVEPVLVASAVSRQPQEPSAKPTVSTGTRPKRSISRPAGTAVSPDEVRKIAGPRPSSPLTPVTSTKVSDETAAVSWRTAEFTAIVAARITVLRLIGRPGGTSVATASFNQPRPEQLLLQCGRGRTRQGRRARGDARAGSRHRLRLTFSPGCLRRLSADSRSDRWDPLPAVAASARRRVRRSFGHAPHASGARACPRSCRPVNGARIDFLAGRHERALRRHWHSSAQPPVHGRAGSLSLSRRSCPARIRAARATSTSRCGRRVSRR